MREMQGRLMNCPISDMIMSTVNTGSGHLVSQYGHHYNAARSQECVGSMYPG